MMLLLVVTPALSGGKTRKTTSGKRYLDPRSSQMYAVMSTYSVCRSGKAVVARLVSTPDKGQ